MVSQQIVDIIIKAQDQASSTAKKVDDSLEKIGETGSRLSNIPGFDAMKSKLSSVATTIDGKFGGALTKARAKFNSLKTTVSGVATNIKTKMSSALDGVRAKLASVSNGAKGLASSMNFLKGAVSMTAGLIGFELLTGLVEAGRASLNAASQVEYFGQRLSKASGETKLSAENFSKFKTELSDLQKEFRKVDMTAVGATAEEISLKMNLPSEKLGDLTRMTAVLSSTFVKEGRTQEDAVLAVGDALDGQFKRLQEIGITEDKLKENGWNGNLEDQAGLIDALNKTMQEMGYEQTAKDITNLDEAMTALTIAGGQLLQKILVPLTPALIAIVDGLIRVTDVVGPMISAFMEAITNMPDWANLALLIGAVVVAVQLVSTWITATLVPALASAALAALEFAAALLANPLTWIVIALAAVAYAIYEIGKAFGWWTDVSSMLDAVWSGIQRLWSAFINHPDVQSVIASIGEAWEWLVEAVGNAWNAVTSFFDLNTGGNFDIVHEIIVGVGEAWDFLRGRIETVISIVQGVIYVFTTIYWVFDMVSQHIGLLVLTFQEFINGQISFSAMLSQIWSILVSMFSSVFNIIMNRLVSFGAQMLSRGIAAATRFVNGIITRIKQLPGKVYSVLLGVVKNIVSAIGQWVSNAKTKAGEIVTGVGSVLSGTATAVSSALSGVKDAIVKPFQDAYNTAKNIWDDITSLGGAFAGEEANGRTSLLDNAGSYSVDNRPVTVEHNLNVNLDLSNVPAHIDTATLGDMITDRRVLDRLVNNSDFQLLDGKAKERLNLKVNRARGV